MGPGAEQVESASLRRGDHVRVAAGAAFPADGRLLEGRTQDRRVAAERRVAAGGQNTGRRPRRRQRQRGRAGADGRRTRRRRHALRGDRRDDARRIAAPALAPSGRPLAGPFLLGVLLLAARPAVWSDRSTAACAVGGGLGAHRHLPLRALARRAWRRWWAAAAWRAAACCAAAGRDGALRRPGVLRQDRHLTEDRIVLRDRRGAQLAGPLDDARVARRWPRGRSTR